MLTDFLVVYVDRMEWITVRGVVCLAWLLLIGVTQAQDPLGTTTVNTISGGGATVAAGTACVFPFTYRNVTYTTCTTVRNDGVFWCSTTAEYDKKWGNCAARDDCE